MMRFLSRFFIALGIFVYLLASGAHARTRRLFTPEGAFVPDYERVLDRTRVGDELVFSDGRSFAITESLGVPGLNEVYASGGNTAVFAISPTEVIRVPLFPAEAPFEAIGHFFSTYVSTFAGGEFPVARVNIERSLAPQVVVVERASGYSMHDFFQERRLRRLGPEVLRVMGPAVARFVRESARFASLYDFADFQVLWSATQRRWLIADWERSPEMAIYRSDRSLVSGFSQELLSTAELTHFRDLVNAERARIGLRMPELCERILRGDPIRPRGARRRTR